LASLSRRQEALDKIAEFADLSHAEILVKDLLEEVVDRAALEAGTDL
jgi:chorismate mutase